MSVSVEAQKSEIFVPSLDVICTYLKLDLSSFQNPKDETITIKVKLLRLLLQMVVAQLPFDPEWYATKYSDIGDAFRAGEIDDLRKHFLERGFFEGRIGAPTEVDEQWYMSQFADVRKALTAGNVESAAKHYESTGAKEWRAPRPQALDALRRWRAALLG